MTREEAISYLQEIKYNLEYLQNHYNNQFWFNGNSDRSKVIFLKFHINLFLLKVFVD